MTRAVPVSRRAWSTSLALATVGLPTSEALAAANSTDTAPGLTRVVLKTASILPETAAEYLVSALGLRLLTADEDEAVVLKPRGRAKKHREPRPPPMGAGGPYREPRPSYVGQPPVLRPSYDRGAAYGQRGDSRDMRKVEMELARLQTDFPGTSTRVRRRLAVRPVRLPRGSCIHRGRR